MQAKFGAVPPELFPGDADLTDPQQPASNDATISVTVNDGKGLTLRDHWFHGTDNFSSAELSRADVIAPTGGFTVKGYAPGFVMMWQIYDEQNKATNYFVGSKFYSPVAGSNKWVCHIYLGSPTIGHQAPTLLSPYLCSWSNYRGADPSPVLTVETGTLVVAKEYQKTILEQYCMGADAADRCAFVNFGYGTALGEYRETGSRVTNDTSQEADREIGGGTEETTVNSVEIGVKVEVGFWKVWQASLSAKYGHEWEATKTFDEKTAFKIAPYSIAWVLFAPMNQTSEGIWVVRGDNDKVYVLPSVTVTGPSDLKGSTLIHECTMSDMQGNVCLKDLKTTVVNK